MAGLISKIYELGIGKYKPKSKKRIAREKREKLAKLQAIKSAAKEQLRQSIANKRDLADSMRKQPTESEFRFGQMLRQAFDQHGYNFRFSIPLFGYIPDFYCDRAKLVIELDGRFHVKRQAYDRRRDLHFQSRGISTLRFPSAQVFSNPAGILEAIAVTLQVSLHGQHVVSSTSAARTAGHVQDGSNAQAQGSRRQHYVKS